MARAPQQRAPQASGEDDFYDDEALYDEGTEGQDSVGGERDEDRGETPGAAEHSGEGGPELEEEGELGFEDEEPPQPRRGEGRVQRLVNERNEYRRRLEELEAQNRQPPQPPQQQGPRLETEQELEQRISFLEESQKSYERWKWSHQQQQSFFQRAQLDTAIQRDRDEWKALCRSDKRYARLADQVEREFEKTVRAGNPAPRLNIFKHLWATQMLEDGQQGTRRAREAAARRVDRQTVKPASGGSDVRASRRERVDDRTARARRLEGQQI